MTSNLDSTEKKIEEILLKHMGKGNPIDAGTIGKMVNIDDNDTHVNTRMIIKSLLIKSDLPIGANSHGYFIISNSDELREYQKNLNGRVNETFDRLAKVTANWNITHPEDRDNPQENIED